MVTELPYCVCINYPSRSIKGMTEETPNARHFWLNQYRPTNYIQVLHIRGIFVNFIAVLQMITKQAQIKTKLNKECPIWLARFCLLGLARHCQLQQKKDCVENTTEPNGITHTGDFNAVFIWVGVYWARRKPESMRDIHWRLLNFPHKPAMYKVFPCHSVTRGESSVWDSGYMWVHCC